MINLFLYRVALNPSYTIGKLSIGTKYFSDTLEDTVRDLNHDGDLDDAGEGKIYGMTAIPYGRYKVGIVWWGKHNKYVPVLLNVKHFTGILIHAGATVKDTLGCILVGLNKVKGELRNSSEYSWKLTTLIQAYLADGEEVYINIV